MKHQQGASYIGILFAIVGFAFLAKVAIAVWGHTLMIVWWTIRLRNF